MADPLVTVSDGPIRGKVRKDVNDEEFFCFEGIPYGEPPVGTLRFKDPVPVTPWKNVKDCTKIGSASLCKEVKISKNPATGELCKEFVLGGSEDCLNLNVYTRQLRSSGSQLKPVMVYFHGGAFVMGNVKNLGPERLITKDIVLVHLHFRLGAFGFLFLDDPTLEVGGNAAMKDKILALKWVQKNIELFNGDPNNVTIFGHSAGAAAVAYLTMSKLATGLFHKAIIQSCSGLLSSGITNEKNGIKLAKALGCEVTDEKEILRYLQSLPAEKIYEGQLKFPDISYPCSFRMFCPRIESKNRKDAFLTEEPIELLTSGNYIQVPTIIGYAEMECIQFMEFNEQCPFNVVCFEEETLTPVRFRLEKGSSQFLEIARKIRKFYYGDLEPEYISLQTVKMFSDIGLIRGIVNSAKHMAKTSAQPTYLYRFSIPKNHGLPYSSKNLNGATHADELPYLFKMGRNTSEALEYHSQKLLKMWTDFAKCGNPTMKKDDVVSVEWKPVQKKNLYYLDIGEELSLKENPESERMLFWDKLYQSFPHTKNY